MQLKDFFLLCIDFFPPLGEIVFLPYFYRKTYTNLLIFVLFVCSFFLLFNLFLFIRFSMISLLNFARAKLNSKQLLSDFRLSSLRDQSCLLPHFFLRALVGTSGLEPPTSRLSGARSNLLSYAPIVF